MHLPVLRFALVILCLPRTDGSEPFTGCQKYSADEFFSTDLSSDFFPASGYSPVPYDSTCDLIIGPIWWRERNPWARMNTIASLGANKVICVFPGTCEWPPFEPRSHLTSADPTFRTVLCQTKVLYGLWLAPGLARR